MNGVQKTEKHSSVNSITSVTVEVTLRYVVIQRT